jgi:NitT/TauT family transport system ATP-binding protein
MTSLVVEGLSHAFGVRTVLEVVGFTLAAGRTLALVGPSGCGKTTALHLVAGLAARQAGHIDNGFARPACVFQQPRLLPWKTALQNIALGLKALGTGRAERERRARELALRMGLANADLALYPSALSGGMQSRVALARALAIEPDLLLLDEPFAALDIGLRTELHALLRAEQRGRGVAMLLITHDLAEAVKLADEICVMATAPGRVVWRWRLARDHAARDEAWVAATAAQLLAAPAVREAFGLPVVASSCAPTADAGGDAPTVIPLEAARQRRHAC